jgi:methenyltetrahydromethanopterin cyclohydrolase
MSLEIVMDMIKNCERLNVAVSELRNKTTVVDCGVNIPGGYKAGEMVTRISLGGVGEARVTNVAYEDIFMPTLDVYTDLPALVGACMGVWPGVVPSPKEPGGAWISGPAKVLAQEPSRVYKDKLDYKDPCPDVAVLIVQPQGNVLPDEKFADLIVNKCKVNPENLYLVVTPTNSITGSTQVSARGLEDNFARLTEYYRIPYSNIESGSSSTPISPISPKLFKEPSVWADDMIWYGGRVHWWIRPPEGFDLQAIVDDVVIENHPLSFGKTFYDVIRKKHPLAPAMDMLQSIEGWGKEEILTRRMQAGMGLCWHVAEAAINDLNTGKMHHAGRIHVDIIKKLIQSPW